MAFPRVSALKFVGTVSLGLLTGLSYTLGHVSGPALLSMQTSENAAPAFRSLVSSARRQITALTAVSAASFLVAFAVSPRYFRHPYLLYTSLLAVLSAAASSESVNPFLQPAARPARSPAAAIHEQKARRERAARARMEASYEVLGSDIHSDGNTSGDDAAADDDEVANLNGEFIRADVEDFVKKQTVRAGVAGLGFLVAVLGIWGDGAVRHVVYRH